jgi:hypothetical protein
LIEAHKIIEGDLERKRPFWRPKTKEEEDVVGLTSESDI